MTDDAVPDVFALIEQTREQPVGHLEDHVTPRDLADLELLHAAGSPQHAKMPSPRSAEALGRLLVSLVVIGLLVMLVVVLSAIASAAADGTAATIDDSLDPLWRLIIALAVVCIVWELGNWIREERRRRRGGGGPP